MKKSKCCKSSADHACGRESVNFLRPSSTTQPTFFFWYIFFFWCRFGAVIYIQSKLDNVITFPANFYPALFMWWISDCSLFCIYLSLSQGSYERSLEIPTADTTTPRPTLTAVRTILYSLSCSISVIFALMMKLSLQIPLCFPFSWTVAFTITIINKSFDHVSTPVLQDKTRIEVPQSLPFIPTTFNRSISAQSAIFKEIPPRDTYFSLHFQRFAENAPYIVPWSHFYPRQAPSLATTDKATFVLSPLSFPPSRNSNGLFRWSSNSLAFLPI